MGTISFFYALLTAQPRQGTLALLDTNNTTLWNSTEVVIDVVFMLAVVLASSRYVPRGVPSTHTQPPG